MPFTHTVLPEKQIAYVTAEGPVDLRASAQAVAALADDPLFRPHFRVLVDLRRMVYRPTPLELAGLASVLADRRQDYQNKVAVLTTDAIAALAALACIFAEVAGFPLRAFTSESAARQWLNEPSLATYAALPGSQPQNEGA